MKRIILLAEAVEDLQQARDFYEKRETGVGAYCITSLIADISSLIIFHGIHRQQHGCFRLLANRFPFGVYYLDTANEIRIVAILDLRRNPSWIRSQIKKRR